MQRKMEFKEFVELENYFEKHLNYCGLNLWKMSEVGMFENFLKFPKKRSSFDKKRDLILRQIVKRKNKKKELEKTEELGKGKEILMVVYGISPINTFKPIIEKVGNKIKVVRYDPPSENVTKEFLEKNKIEYSNIDNYINEEIKKKLREAGKWLNKKWKEIKKDEELKEKLGENYIYVYEALEYFCKTRKSYLELIRLAELYKRMYEIEKPKVLIVSDDANAYGRIAVEIAKEKGVKTLSIQHGQLEGNVVARDAAEKLIVNGFKDKAYLISQGVGEKKIEVTGQIRCDKIVEKMKLCREELCDKYNLDSNKKIVVFTAQKKSPGENMTLKAFECVLRLIKNLEKENIEWVVKLPPNINENAFPKIPPKLKLRLAKKDDLYELLSCCDVSITAFSTAGIEAVLIGKPIIAINIDAKPEEYTDYTKLGVGFKITKEENLIPALKTCLENKKFKENFKKSREKFIQDYNYNMDGKALDRILRIIEDNLS